MSRIRKLLVANRGEIACRIMKSAKARGVRTVAIFSDADATARHVRQADETVHIGGSEASQSYLKIDAVLDAAKRSGADAIHPGYGFLSERAAFAEACETAGLTFVGPPASAIAAMGDKAESKRRMIAAGVPTIPGYQDEDQADATLIEAAKHIGFPVMLKASAGGGGRGQRIVSAADELPEAIASARRESISAFGDGRLIVEKAIVGARHVEIQVVADAHGAILHLGERDCSLQRRRQKVIEEAPSPVVTHAIRARMGEAAVEAARAVGYRNAGTVEFLFDPATQEFYFLEMNTRLQVEHPVTEFVTGIDLVDLQLDIAEGAALPFAQKDIRLDGWAIEARLYAEDPSAGFMPSSGVAHMFNVADDVRVDRGIDAGDIVSTFYDPMIAKVIAHGRTRDEARLMLANALRRLRLLGFASNREFLIALLEDEGFAAGRADIGYVERELARLSVRPAPAGALHHAVAAAALLDMPCGDHLNGWNSRGAASFPLTLADHGGAVSAVRVRQAGDEISVEGDAAAAGGFAAIAGGRVIWRGDGVAGSVDVHRRGSTVELQDDAGWSRLTDVSRAPAMEMGVGDAVVRAPMAGVVTGLRVAVGDAVAKGAIVATVEAMKMEHQLRAGCDGVVSAIFAAEGDQVSIRAKILSLEA